MDATKNEVKESQRNQNIIEEVHKTHEPSRNITSQPKVLIETLDQRGNLEPNLTPLHMRDLRAVPVEKKEDDLAGGFYKNLCVCINEFNRRLDDGHEVGVRVLGFDKAVNIRLEEIGYCDPDLITFRGKTTDYNKHVELIQHVSQISILLINLPRENPNEPKQPFGLRTNLKEQEKVSV